MDGVSGHCLCALDRRGNHLFRPDSAARISWLDCELVGPGVAASGGDSARLVVEPSGRVDLHYQGYHVTNITTYTLNPAYSYFTSSIDGGSTWSTPLKVGPQAGTMSLAEWWIDGDIAMDAAGTLYATWDTQGTNRDGTANDIGWLSWPTHHGQHWSSPVQATPNTLDVPPSVDD